MPRYPAEWEPHWGTLLAWPRSGSDWAPWLEAVRKETLELAHAILKFEHLLMLCPDAQSAAYLKGQLTDPARHPFTPIVVDYEDTWTRDYGPQSVYRHGQLELIDFRYNAWGGKYPHETDDAVSMKLHADGYWPASCRRVTDLTLEGGALETDGEGTLLVRTSTLVDPNRNPGMSKKDIGQRLRQHLDIERVLWLDEGQLAGDDTDGHIDTLARFTATGGIIYQPGGPTDPIRSALESMPGPNGGPFQLTALPIADVIHAEDDPGSPLPASYANYLHVNGGIIVPAYGCPQDLQALSLIAKNFPDRTVVSSPARSLIEQYGSLHCATLHIAAPTDSFAQDQ